jgi:hypothetical protein
MTDFTDGRCVPLPSAVVHGSREHGLLVCLGLERAAVTWHVRRCQKVPGARMSRAVPSAREALGVRIRPPARAALRGLCQQRRLQDLTES